MVAEFDLPAGHAARAVLAEAGIEAEDGLILRRVNTADGRKTAFVNDRRVSGEPSTKPKASSRIDFPAPVSPVSTFRPGAKSKVSRSMISTSRISRLRSIAATGRVRDLTHLSLIHI